MLCLVGKRVHWPLKSSRQKSINGSRVHYLQKTQSDDT